MRDVKNRLVAIDIIKGFAIILVVIGHYIPNDAPNWYIEMRNIIYVFHMPLFLFASGYVYQTFRSDISIMKFYKKKVERLMIPYITTSIIVILIKMLVESIMPVENPVEIDSIVKIFYLPEAGYYLWYIWSLFTIFLFIPFINTPIKIISLFVLSLIVPHLPIEWTEVFSLKQTVLMLQYFIAGVLIAEYGGVKQQIERFPIVASIIMLLLFVVGYYYRNIEIVWLKNIWNVVLPYIGICLMCLIAMAVKRCGGAVKLFTFLSSCSFIIYLFHTTFEGFAKAVLEKLIVANCDTYLYIVRVFLVVSCGIIFPVLLQKVILEKSQLLKKLFGLK